MSPRPSPRKKKNDTKAPQKRTDRPTPLVNYPPRLPRETDAAYGALCTYLDAGPDRSLRAVFAGGRLTPAKVWSSANDWQARASAWDDAVRAARLAAVQSRQCERDLATLESDAQLAAAATAALFSDDEPTRPGMGLVRDLYRVARSGADNARIQAIQTLVDLAGIKDLRKLRHHQATQPAPPPSAAPLLTSEVIAALDAAATDEQLAALSSPLVDDPPEPRPPHADP